MEESCVDFIFYFYKMKPYLRSWDVTPEKSDLAVIFLEEPCVFFFSSIFVRCETISDVPKGAVTPCGIQISDLSVSPLEEPCIF